MQPLGGMRMRVISALFAALTLGAAGPAWGQGVSLTGPVTAPNPTAPVPGTTGSTFTPGSGNTLGTGVTNPATPDRSTNVPGTGPTYIPGASATSTPGASATLVPGAGLTAQPG